MSIDRSQRLSVLFSFLGGVMLLFVVAPLLNMIVATDGGRFMETVRDATVRDSIWLTLWTALIATLGIALFGIPFAYVLARNDFPGKRIVLGLIDLPVIIPHSAAGIAVLGVISRNSLIGGLGERLGINFVGGEAGIVCAMAFVSLPFLMSPAYNGFKSVDRRLEYAARTLGASPLAVFFTVSIPLAWRHIVSGMTLMWARGISEFGAVVIIAYHPITAPVLVFERFGAFGLKYARPVAVLLIIVCMAVFVILRLLADRESYDSR